MTFVIMPGEAVKAEQIKMLYNNCWFPRGANHGIPKGRFVIDPRFVEATDLTTQWLWQWLQAPPQLCTSKSHSK